eukprot:TRINITY_DN25990_c0_g1_i2.p2 TRINITY_DN25990_c0_g1~~TRINITY_DN25990_c0_g1_i2.p2  ORF type:complete len:128 (-),score=16.89 TRINITY_DN25990_c0_g1_i2:67-450(-)
MLLLWFSWLAFPANALRIDDDVTALESFQAASNISEGSVPNVDLPSCKHYGCHAHSRPCNKCQCYRQCAAFGDCCFDYHEVCAHGKSDHVRAAAQGTCREYDCAKEFIPGQLCQCNSGCQKFGTVVS